MHIHQTNGHIEVVTGCMFAGKTEELLRRLRRAEIANQEVGVFKPVIDTRYSKDEIGSHNGESWDAKVIDTERENPDELYTLGREYDVIAIDEFNFFTDEFIQPIKKLATDDVRVILSGLDQNFRGNPFEPVHIAMAIADEVDKLSAICESCGDKATMTQRLIDGDPAPADAPTVKVGGEETYEARCRNCHMLL